MGLSVYLKVVQPTEVFGRNITHNLTDMARAVGLYEYLWRPEDLGITFASQLIEPLAKGLELLKRDKDDLLQYNAPNGWGNYENLLEFVEKYQAACVEYPDATVVSCA